LVPSETRRRRAVAAIASVAAVSCNRVAQLARSVYNGSRLSLEELMQKIFVLASGLGTILIGSLLCAGVFVLVPACSLDSPSHKDGAVDSVPGAGGRAGAVGTGGAAGWPSSRDSAGSRFDAVGATDIDAAGAGADCEVPCLGAAANLIAACKPAGACTYQIPYRTGLTDTILNGCYDNGLKISTGNVGASADAPYGQGVMTVKNNGALCYSLSVVYADASKTPGSYVYRDATGATVMTDTMGVIRFGGQVVYAAADHRRTDISYSIGLV
jgi:hypothetical protein